MVSKSTVTAHSEKRGEVGDGKMRAVMLVKWRLVL